MTRPNDETVVTTRSLSWTPTPRYENKLRGYARKWLRENPEQCNEDDPTFILRTIYTRVSSNLLNAVLPAYDPEISHKTVWGDIVRQKDLYEGSEEWNLLKTVFDLEWHLSLMFFDTEFTEHAPH